MTESEKREKRVCFTGHRPENLDLSERAVKKALQKEILVAIEEGMHVFICGMSRGVDIWAAEIILKLRKKNPDIKLICAIPFKGFESRWTNEWKAKYYNILDNADLIRYICPEFSYSAYHIRNKWMIDHSKKVIAVYNGTESGTQSTIMYAEKKGVNVINVYRRSSLIF